MAIAGADRDCPAIAHRFGSIADEVGGDAMQVVGIDLDAGGRVGLIPEGYFTGLCEGLEGGFLDGRMQADGLDLRARHGRSAIFQCVAGELDGAFEGPLQARRGALHARVIRCRERVGRKLSGGERIAQIMIDLGDGLAELGKSLSLAECIGDGAFHVGQRVLGAADLILPRGRREALGPAARVFAEADDGFGDALHGAHDEQEEKKVDQRPCGQRNQQRQPEDAPAEGGEAFLEWGFGQDDLQRATRRRAHGAHDEEAAVFGVPGVDGLHDRAHHAFVHEIDHLHRAGQRHGRGKQLFAHVLAEFGYGQHFGAFEQVVGKLIRHHTAWRGLERQGGNARGLHPLVEPVGAVIRGARQEDQEFNQQDHEDCDEKKPDRQAVEQAGPAPAGRRCRCVSHAQGDRLGDALKQADKRPRGLAEDCVREVRAGGAFHHFGPRRIRGNEIGQ